MTQFTYREATRADVPQIQVVRHLVKENVLSDPALVTDADCIRYIEERGKGWVCYDGDRLTGFAIADLQEHSIWALFLDPMYEGRGIGKELHRVMLDWYFSQTDHPAWLSTAYNTRAERFYALQGWRDAGAYNAKERKFEITREEWENARSSM
ncbi:MAG: GNAT family N-acetyltransferase [Chitinophagaceae bacterium]|nr:MAG: GNAT family N-acetyltransferase [Chitinophagaceae bacterium]